jgi:hypothetical protein
MEIDYDDATQEALILMGASYVAKSKTGFRVGLAQTTWLQDADEVKSEPSLVHAGDTVVATAEDYLVGIYGGKAYGGPQHEAQFLVDLKRVLSDAKANGLIVDSTDATTGEIIPAARDFKVSFANKTWNGAATVTLSEPGKYLTLPFAIAQAGVAAV